jgi:hypothetical protein
MFSLVSYEGKGTTEVQNVVLGRCWSIVHYKRLLHFDIIVESWEVILSI